VRKRRRRRKRKRRRRGQDIVGIFRRIGVQGKRHEGCPETGARQTG
jgi:hypothetical protein